MVGQTVSKGLVRDLVHTLTTCLCTYGSGVTVKMVVGKEVQSAED